MNKKYLYCLVYWITRSFMGWLGLATFFDVFFGIATLQVTYYCSLGLSMAKARDAANMHLLPTLCCLRIRQSKMSEYTWIANPSLLLHKFHFEAPGTICCIYFKMYAWKSKRNSVIITANHGMNYLYNWIIFLLNLKQKTLKNMRNSITQEKQIKRCKVGKDEATSLLKRQLELQNGLWM